MKGYALVYCLLLLGTLFVLETTPWAQSLTIGTWTQFLADLNGGLMQAFDCTVVLEGLDLRNSRLVTPYRSTLVATGW